MSSGNSVLLQIGHRIPEKISLLLLFAQYPLQIDYADSDILQKE